MALGTMTFGTDWGWGADAAESRRLFDAYVERGGNLIDTANNYTDGTSERLLGEFARGRRDQLVIATKYTCSTRRADPNSGGNHRKSMIASVESSLERLQTDYIDLLYLHLWDGTTPVEEILRGLDDLVRAGKVLYVGISDTPAWQVSRMQAIAELRGWAPLIALQVEYSLIERTTERELIPMAGEMGLGVLPWAPLAKGVLTGKYSRADLGLSDGTQTRKNLAAAAGVLSERGLAIADAVRGVAAEIGRTPSQVALAWTLLNPAVTAPIIGARTLSQLEDNLGRARGVPQRRPARHPGAGQRHRPRLSPRPAQSAQDPRACLRRHSSRRVLKRAMIFRGMPRPTDMTSEAQRVVITAFERSPDGGKGLARDMRVRWALEEVGEPYDVCLVSFREKQEAAHLRLHPFGLIPTYQEGDLTLFETGAIVLHLADTHAGLFPQDPNARARAITWMFAAVNTVEPPILELVTARILEGDKPWAEERLPLVAARIRDRLTALSAYLGEADWLDGDFSAGDLMMVSVLLRLRPSGLLDEFPKLAAYVARGEARPAYERAFAAQWAINGPQAG